MMMMMSGGGGDDERKKLGIETRDNEFKRGLKWNGKEELQLYIGDSERCHEGVWTVINPSAYVCRAGIKWQRPLTSCHAGHIFDRSLSRYRDKQLLKETADIAPQEGGAVPESVL